LIPGNGCLFLVLAKLLTVLALEGVERILGIRVLLQPKSVSELVQLKLNIESSVGESTPTEAETESHSHL